MKIQISKLQSRQIFLLLLILLAIAIFVYSVMSIDQRVPYINKSNQKNIIVKSQLALPVRLVIPKIEVDSKIEYMGVTETGSMDVPDNAVNVGWFQIGPRPGERGSAVIAGHFDGKNGEDGVFKNLYKLVKGDEIHVKDKDGISTTFSVRESRTYEPGFADEVFEPNDGTYLNLVTCDGVWDGAVTSYTMRLVIFSDIIPLR